jgi:hypothetical protein
MYTLSDEFEVRRNDGKTGAGISLILSKSFEGAERINDHI